MDEENKIGTDEKMPAEPMSKFGEGALAWHTAFESMMEGGFTEKQALQLLANIIVAGFSDNDDESS